MQKIPAAVREVMTSNPLLQMGLNHRLFNLSQLSRHILPQIKARTKKEVQPSAILMSLSRLQQETASTKIHREKKFVVRNITINSDLFVATFPKTRLLPRAISTLHSKIEQRDGFLTVSQGMAQTTLMLEKKNLELLRQVIKERPLREFLSVASLALRFDDEYLEVPGFLYLVLQQLYLQNINVIELTSTATELILYLNEKDVRLAFDTIYNRFSGR